MTTPSLPEAAKLARQLFHRHLKSRGIPSELFQHDEAGAYEYVTVQNEWQVWQAALAASAEPMEPVATGRVHELKTDPEVFEAVWTGAKTFEIRRNDRGFEVGDALDLRETKFAGDQMHIGRPLEYTGRRITKVVSHVLSGYGLSDHWVCLSFATPPAQAEPSAQEPVEWPRIDRYSGDGDEIHSVWVRFGGKACTEFHAVGHDPDAWKWEVPTPADLEALATPSPQTGAQEPDVPDIIAGALQCSRAYAYTLMERALAERNPQTNVAAAVTRIIAVVETELKAHIARDSTDRLRSRIEAILATQAAPVAAAVQAPAEGAQKWPASWLREGYNGALVVAAEALRYLADNDRPSGGSSSFNSEHLFQLARELDKSREVLLVTPQPQPPSPEQAQAKQDVQGREIHTSGYIQTVKPDPTKLQWDEYPSQQDMQADAP